jgi:hypothetical protein
LTLLVLSLVLCVLPAEAPQASADAAELMRPTRYGIRMSPRMARGFASQWLRMQPPGFELTPQERNRLIDGLSGGIQRLAREHHGTLQPFFEYQWESWLMGGSKMAPEQAKQFGPLAQPVAPVMREFLEFARHEGQKRLPAEKATAFDRHIDRCQKAVDRWEQQMARWAQGGMMDREQPFDLLEDLDVEDASESPRVRQARRQSREWFRTLGPPAWEHWLKAAKALFEFDAEQSARADAILEQYRERARSIMTPEWQQRARENRARRELRGQLWRARAGPYLFELEREYRELMRPMEELDNAFYQEVLALLTSQQRDAVVSELRDRFRQHGLIVEDADAPALLGEQR